MKTAAEDNCNGTTVRPAPPEILLYYLYHSEQKGESLFKNSGMNYPAENYGVSDVMPHPIRDSPECQLAANRGELNL